MEKEWICPICGSRIARRASVYESTEQSGVTYGTPMSLGMLCENLSCGFGLAFPFDQSVYHAYACEELRLRTRDLPADQRARALVASLGHSHGDGKDEASEVFAERVNAVFMEALGEILKNSRELLSALSHPEPDGEKRRHSREELEIFWRFLDFMEDRYPTARLERDFRAVEESLRAMDYFYELGMLARETDLGLAEEYFRQGTAAGGIRSKVAYVKYILSGKDDGEEDGERVKNAFLELTPLSQEACCEYMRLARIGEDDLAAAFLGYEETSYEALSISGKLAFVRLELSACVQKYEAALAELLAVDENNAPQEVSDDLRERVLAEMTALVTRIVNQCEELLDEIEDHEDDALSDPIAERASIDEENALVEYVIGCTMYFGSCLDPEKRFDTVYLRQASGHFSAFLSSELVETASKTELEIPSMIGFRDLRRVFENAKRYRQTLAEWSGFWEESR